MRVLRFSPALLAVALLAACSTPAEAPSGDTPEAPTPEATTPEASGEPHPWLVEARALSASDDNGPDDRREALLAEIDADLGWQRACDTYYDYEAEEMVYDPTDGGAGRGWLDVTDVSDTEGVLSISCLFGAYQGTYALIYIEGDRARLLRTPAISAGGQPLAETHGWFAETWLDEIGTGTFTTYAKYRGLGDCGEHVEYTIGETDVVTIQEVRLRDCGPDIPDPLPPPSEWPVVYTAR
ncbi:MAG: DUF1176 domain-containing protein [Bacteroidota bacterium]